MFGLFSNDGKIRQSASDIVTMINTIVERHGKAVDDYTDDIFFLGYIYGLVRISFKVYGFKKPADRDKLIYLVYGNIFANDGMQILQRCAEYTKAEQFMHGQDSAFADVGGYLKAIEIGFEESEVLAGNHLGMHLQH